MDLAISEAWTSCAASVWLTSFRGRVLIELKSERDVVLNSLVKILNSRLTEVEQL